MKHVTPIMKGKVIGNPRCFFQTDKICDDILHLKHEEPATAGVTFAISTDIHALAALPEDEINQLSPSLRRYVLMWKQKQGGNES